MQIQIQNRWPQTVDSRSVGVDSQSADFQISNRWPETVDSQSVDFQIQNRWPETVDSQSVDSRVYIHGDKRPWTGDPVRVTCPRPRRPFLCHLFGGRGPVGPQPVGLYTVGPTDPIKSCCLGSEGRQRVTGTKSLIRQVIPEVGEAAY